MSSKIEKMKEGCLIVFEKAFRVAPIELQSLRNKSLAWVYQYFTDLYLRYSTDMSGINQASENLWIAIRLHPQILLQKHTQSLVKWFIKNSILLRFPILNKYGIN